MDRRTTTSIFTLLILTLFLLGCSYISAKDEIKTAQRFLAELKAAGGEISVPYEYCSSEAYLEAAKLEFEHHDFKRSKEFANRSKSAAQKGLTEIKKK